MKAIRPHASFIPNMSGASLMEFDLELIEKHCPFLVVDDQGRRGTEPLWMAGRNGKRMRATFRERPVILITSIGPEEEYRWKDAVTTGPEMPAWIDNGTAHGMLPWFTKFNGVVPDTRWVEPVAEAFGLHADLEPVLGGDDADRRDRDHRSQRRRCATGRPRSRKQAESDDLGFYQALVEAKLPFELLSDQVMTPERLDALQGRDPRQRPLPLGRAVRRCSRTTSPAAAASSPPSRPRPATRTASRATASASGSCFGATPRRAGRAARSRTPTSRSTATHPVNARLRRRRAHHRRHAADRRSRRSTGAEQPFLFVPDFPDLPMEEVYPREEPRGAAVIARETERRPHGLHPLEHRRRSSGRCWPPTIGRLIANAVRWALGKPSRVEVDRQGACSTSRCARTTTALAVVLHNLTNPMMMKGPIREIYPGRAARRSRSRSDGRKRRRRAAARRRPRRARPRVEDGRVERRGARHRHARGRAPDLGV